jgi:protein gp37
VNKTKIDWPFDNLYSWNPVYGCKHGCKGCYAQRIAVRWHGGDFEPQFREDILNDKDFNGRQRKHRHVFTVDMGDLFGAWVPAEWIERVIDKAKNNPQFTYLFLTQNPARYRAFKFPPNTWIGTTIKGENKSQDETRIQYLLEYPYENVKRYLSIEPLLGPICEISPFINLCIVGAMSGPGAVPVKQDWLDSIKHTNIYFKNSIKKGDEHHEHKA